MHGWRKRRQWSRWKFRRALTQRLFLQPTRCTTPLFISQLLMPRCLGAWIRTTRVLMVQRTPLSSTPPYSIQRGEAKRETAVCLPKERLPVRSWTPKKWVGLSSTSPMVLWKTGKTFKGRWIGSVENNSWTTTRPFTSSVGLPVDCLVRTSFKQGPIFRWTAVVWTSHTSIV